MKIEIRLLNISLTGILLLIMFSACLSPVPISPTSKIYWVEDPQAGIQTNDVERLQKITPFTMVFPKYLPEELKKYPAWLIKKTVSGNPASIITVQYDNHVLENPKSVDIDESNSSVWVLDENRLSISLNYQGINVTEQKTIDPFMPSDTPNQQQDVYIYLWEANGIFFHSSIEGCDQAEARKIIESMIK
jgi:hypothetical protein